MKIITLVENTTSSPVLRCKHGLSLYIETTGHKILFDLGQNGLFAENAKKQGKIMVDSFDHEHSLLITEKNKKVLVAGCSHAGIVNIQRKAGAVAGQKINAVIGGFHLYNPSTKKYESAALMDEVAAELIKTAAVYYTGHCTGIKAYERMKNTLGERLQYLSTGSIIEIPER